jgi:hypothetical protein
MLQVWLCLDVASSTTPPVDALPGHPDCLAPPTPSLIPFVPGATQMQLSPSVAYSAPDLL